MEIVVHTLAIGGGATACMDLWALALRRCCGVSSLDYALLGRWIGHLARGRVRHAHIAQAAPIRHERVLGWTAHYTIGIVFAALLLATAGLDWLRHPTLGPSLLVSSVTLVAPFFVMQPAMGAGVAGSRTPWPNITRLRSIATHSIYGIGLYLSAWMLNVLAR
jgi:hypothetical protein